MLAHNHKLYKHEKYFIFSHNTILLLGNLSCSSSNPSSYKVLPSRFDDTENLVGINVFVITDSVQRRSDKGIRFAMKIENNTDSSIIIQNVIDTFSIHLLNAFNKDILYPYTPRMFVHHRGRYVYHSFIIENIQINKKLMPLEVQHEKNLKIPAKGNVKFSFRIQNILSPDAQKPNSPEKTIRIPAGGYSLLLSLHILTNEKSKLFTLDPLSINISNV
jgi:hypothetical protein